MISFSFSRANLINREEALSENKTDYWGLKWEIWLEAGFLYVGLEEDPHLHFSRLCCT